MKLNVYNNTQEVIAGIAALFINCAKQSIHESGQFNVSLSGGSSPKKLYEFLVSGFRNDIDWNKVYFFFGDERYVPHDHPDSNYLMAKNALFAPLLIHEDKQVFKVNTSLDPLSAALDYQRNICTHFNNNPIFDLILLGLGDDAHTASLFPNTNILWIDEEYVKEVYLADKEVYRISMTAPLINQARYIAFLTYGETKAEAIQAVLERPKNIMEYPAQLINPAKGELYWFIDSAAASKLTKNPGS